MNWKLILLVLGVTSFVVLNIILQWDCWVSAKCARDEFVTYRNRPDYLHLQGYGTKPWVTPNFVFLDTLERSCSWIIPEILIILIALVLMMRFCWSFEG